VIPVNNNGRFFFILVETPSKSQVGTRGQSHSGLDSESKFQMFTPVFSGRNVRVNLHKILRRISEVLENAQY